MEALSYLVLIILSLVAYSGGVAVRAGKGVDLKPTGVDIFLVLLIWAGAVYSRLAYDFNKWLMILMWVMISVAIGIGTVSLRRKSGQEKSDKEEIEEPSLVLFKRLWERWKKFSRKMGSFQSRVLLSFFFFLLITPAALLVKGLGDPLRIKKGIGKESFWNLKPKAAEELEDFRKQF